MRTLSRALLLVMLPALACGPQEAVDEADLDLGTTRHALGEPNGGYPNYQERVFHYLTNRSRLAPKDAVVCGQGFNVPVTGTLEWNLQLNHVARYHAREMSLAPCFQHEGCSFLIGNGLSACSSAKPPDAGGTCTKSNESFCMGYDPVTQACNAKCPTDDRLKTFYRFGVFGYQGQTMGENIAAGQKDGKEAFCDFFLEGPENGDGKEHGHFVNIVKADWNEVGHGYFAGPANGGCNSYVRYYSQDFGGRNGVTLSTIPSAVMWQQDAPANSAPIFGAIWNDTSSPTALNVVVDGTCYPLALKTPSPTVGAYEATVHLSPGCHSYYFVGKTQSGRTVEYPTNGSLVAPVGTTCPNDYVTTREVGTCSTCTPGLTCSRGECRTGVLQCPASGPVCGNIANRPDGTPCAGGETCQGGLCGGCKAGSECTTIDGCQKGKIDCSSGEPVCSGLAPVTDGTECDTGKQCWSGVCKPCAAGDTCRTVDGCQQGTLVCEPTPSCGGTLTNLTDGTVCGPSSYCVEGTCAYCPSGSRCDDPGGDPCKKGKTDCSSGRPICTDPQVVANGSGCGPDKVCNAGACVTCKANVSCNVGNPCMTGFTDCSTGTSQCVGLSEVSNGTRCGTGKICVAGDCQQCVDGADCSSTDECRVGKWKCSVGGAFCQNEVPLPDGTACKGGECRNGGCAPISAPDAGPVDAPDAGPADAGSAQYDVEKGCGCTGGAGPAMLWPGLLAMVLLRRRRA